MKISSRLITVLKRSLQLAVVSGLVVITLVVAASYRVQQAAEGRLFETVEEAPSAPVAIVLGARVYADGRPSDSLVDRLATALDLYEAGKVSRILVTGDHGTRGYDEVHPMRDWLLKKGVASEDIFMDHAGFRTLDSVFRAARVFGVERAIICTQRYHLPRSIYLAREAGIDAMGVVADRHRYAGQAWFETRERLARAKAWADIEILNTSPRLDGPIIPITGDARGTWDGSTASR